MPSCSAVANHHSDASILSFTLGVTMALLISSTVARLAAQASTRTRVFQLPRFHMQDGTQLLVGILSLDTGHPIFPSSCNSRWPCEGWMFHTLQPCARETGKNVRVRHGRLICHGRLSVLLHRPRTSLQARVSSSPS